LNKFTKHAEAANMFCGQQTPRHPAKW